MSEDVRYGYALVIWQAFSFVEIQSTEPELLTELTKQVQEKLPKCHPERLLNVFGEDYVLNLKKLSNKDQEVGLWIIRELCHQGWEPFATEVAGQGAAPSHNTHFRKRLR